MKLHFSWTQIEKALEEVRTASTARPLYEEETGKGLWLVGDEGVYLMPAFDLPTRDSTCCWGRGEGRTNISTDP